ncbi:lycopene cyclase family protein [Abyssalbus ytuae]|uniref:Lycopene cyclase family protein n=1 Tax=Abyssalbus ytuae TaxID=2926907 RepID=A0A9E6ZSQ1_9FLAO|nr:lycopene cyclase family protein [Abyssalbus ytuae]UOB15976.1 lycopene cyclase family protein [Abyssalbus ytuae]
MIHADYIITGGGASGLLLAHRFASDPFFAEKSILIIEKEEKNSNDRTWCFWEAPNGEFDFLVHKKWDEGIFSSENFKKAFSFLPYQYKMIRSAHFYSYIHQELKTKNNITLLKESVIDIRNQQQKVIVKTNNNTYSCHKCFNSILNTEPVLNQKKYPVIQQHFSGWFIKTDKECFDEDKMTFMDFNIPQKGNTRFMYVLPFNKTEALVEYTLFSEHLLPEKTYEEAIKKYLEREGIKNYLITEKEKGSIPMTSYEFWKNNSKNIINIGTAGGWAKASTGYTFSNTLHKTSQLTEFLKTENDLSKFSRKNRYWYYDLLLLDILHKTNAAGSTIFSSLFKKNDPAEILKFLDEKTSLYNDFKIMLKAPVKPFLNALLKRLF